MERVLVFGATGYTGRLVVEALERMERPYVIAGRSRERLEAMASALKQKPEVRVADPTRPETLAGLFEGVRAVANTVGPFRKFGIPVVQAAIDQGVHYVDTTGEQSFQKEVAERFHGPAKKAGVSIITGQAFEYAFSYCGAWVLQDLFGPLEESDTYHRVFGFGVSRGTAKSALGMLAVDHWTLRNGQIVLKEARWSPELVTFPEEIKTHFAIEIPAGDTVLLSREMPSLRRATCNLVLPGGQARVLAVMSALNPVLRLALRAPVLASLERYIDRNTKEPTDAQRQAVKWTVLVRGRGPRGTHTCRIDGSDAYGITGDAAALGAAWLADGEGRETGVLTTGKAFGGARFLDGLKERGVCWDVE